MHYSNIISTADTAQNLDNPDWLFFDCRFELSEPVAGEYMYKREHLPGAQYAHLEKDLSGPVTRKNGRHPLPDPTLFAKQLGLWGIDSNKQVVAYDDGLAIYAARFWWLLRWMGHNRVAVMDGGFKKWLKEKRPITAERPVVQPTEFTGGPRPEQQRDLAWLQAHINEPQLKILDARSLDRFNGIGETFDPVGGHIPGAENRFFRRNFDEEGCFKSPQDLQEEYQAILGEHKPNQVVHTCGSGVSACNNLLAMEVAGLSGSVLYPGSWSEWCANVPSKN